MSFKSHSYSSEHRWSHYTNEKQRLRLRYNVKYVCETMLSRKNTVLRNSLYKKRLAHSKSFAVPIFVCSEINSQISNLWYSKKIPVCYILCEQECIHISVHQFCCTAGSHSLVFQQALVIHLLFNHAETALLSQETWYPLLGLHKMYWLRH